MKLSKEQLADLARILGSTADEELTCDEMLDHVAAFIEARRDQANIGPQLQQVSQHLTICPDCHEEFIALLRAEGIDPAKILD